MCRVPGKVKGRDRILTLAQCWSPRSQLIHLWTFSINGNAALITSSAQKPSLAEGIKEVMVLSLAASTSLTSPVVQPPSTVSLCSLLSFAENIACPNPQAIARLAFLSFTLLLCIPTLHSQERRLLPPHPHLLAAGEGVLCISSGTLPQPCHLCWLHCPQL